MKTLEEKLPLFLNGQLSEPESQQLQREIAANPALASELRFLQNLRRGLQEPLPDSPGEMGLARLKRDIERARSAEQNTSAAKTKSYWKPLALTACTLLGLQLVFFAATEFTPARVATDIQPATGEQSISGPRLQVVFNDQATAAQIRSALLAVNGRIISGPGALGVYTVVLQRHVTPEQAQAKLAALAFVDEVNIL